MATYALPQMNRFDLTLLTEMKEDDKDFKIMFYPQDLEFKSSDKWHSKQLKDTVKETDDNPTEIQKNTNKWEIINCFLTSNMIMG